MGTTYGTPGAGGAGGGGAGAQSDTQVATAGQANTGGGGGGNTTKSDGTINSGLGGAAGGSGIVIIAYPDTKANITTIGAGLTYTLDTSSRSGFKVYKFTAGSDTITI
jgi:hypothetical protein